jgi:fatty-acid desaturase
MNLKIFGLFFTIFDIFIIILSSFINNNTILLTLFILFLLPLIIGSFFKKTRKIFLSGISCVFIFIFLFTFFINSNNVFSILNYNATQKIQNNINSIN